MSTKYVIFFMDNLGKKKYAILVNAPATGHCSAEVWDWNPENVDQYILVWGDNLMTCGINTPMSVIKTLPLMPGIVLDNDKTVNAKQLKEIEKSFHKLKKIGMKVVHF